MKNQKRSLKSRVLSLSVGGLVAILLFNAVFSSPSDSYIRDRAVKLSSAKGSCSGVQVRAPSGVDYILTAAHCRVLAEDGSILVTKEDGSVLLRKVIQEDSQSDLLLLQGLPNVRGLSIADYNMRFNHVRTFTHGAGLSTYKTDGHTIQDREIQVLVSLGDDPEAPPCEGAKYRKMAVESIFGDMMACIMDVEETVTDAMIVPGSSGGMIVDDSGDIVGIVSAGGGGFGFLVRIQDIHNFLRGY